METLWFCRLVQHRNQRESSMLDILMVGVAAAFFGLMALYAAACDRV